MSRMQPCESCGLDESASCGHSETRWTATVAWDLKITITANRVSDDSSHDANWHANLQFHRRATSQAVTSEQFSRSQIKRRRHSGGQIQPLIFCIINQTAISTESLRQNNMLPPGSLVWQKPVKIKLSRKDLHDTDILTTPDAALLPISNKHPKPVPSAPMFAVQSCHAALSSGTKRTRAHSASIDVND